MSALAVLQASISITIKGTSVGTVTFPAEHPFLRLTVPDKPKGSAIKHPANFVMHKLLHWREHLEEEEADSIHFLDRQDDVISLMSKDESMLGKFRRAFDKAVLSMLPTINLKIRDTLGFSKSQLEELLSMYVDVERVHIVPIEPGAVYGKFAFAQVRSKGSVVPEMIKVNHGNSMRVVRIALATTKPKKQESKEDPMDPAPALAPVLGGNNDKSVHSPPGSSVISPASSANPITNAGPSPGAIAHDHAGDDPKHASISKHNNNDNPTTNAGPSPGAIAHDHAGDDLKHASFSKHNNNNNNNLNNLNNHNNNPNRVNPNPNGNYKAALSNSLRNASGPRRVLDRCVAHYRGDCRTGGKCRFDHIDLEPCPNGMIACEDYIRRGRCSRNPCHNFHPDPSRPSGAADAPTVRNG